MGEAKREVLAWVDSHLSDLSDWHDVLWHFAEPAFREYKSSAWYVDCLHAAGFTVEIGSGGMPTAFAASFTNGPGPTLAAYAEYDAVPGNCQAAATTRQPRRGLSKYAPGHTDPHSALGISARRFDCSSLVRCSPVLRASSIPRGWRTRSAAFEPQSSR
jgi:aminobenzoyl-glutamate utilization protein B